MPYAGYFRLFAVVDVFVAFDCVQFPRRGWVHRNRFTDAKGELQWLTLPLKKGDRDTTRICDLEFQDDAATKLAEQTRKFPALKSLQESHLDLSDAFFSLSADPTSYLVMTLQKMAAMLEMEKPIIRSSTLNIAPELKGQERIIEIAKQVGAKNYINAPGGRDIYDSAKFEQAGLTLNFLPDYKGGFSSILERMINEGAVPVANEIRLNLT